MNGVANNGSLQKPRSGDMLVIGVGNVLRGDDGVGPAVVEAVEALEIRGLRGEAHHQLTPELSVRLGEVAFVVFVDASVKHATGGVVVRELGGQDDVGGIGWTGHHLTPEGLLALSMELCGCRPRAWCVEVSVEEFGWGPGLTAQTRRGVRMAVEAIRVLKGSQECMKQA
jgi:hydrogenase maturation protease